MRINPIDLSPKSELEFAMRQSIGDWLAFHNLLTDQRLASKLTQQEVADTLGITQPAISVFEGNNSDAKISTLVSYAAALGLKINFSVEKVTWPKTD
jgi:predicted XRE-type DNA-binding protein